MFKNYSNIQVFAYLKSLKPLVLLLLTFSEGSLDLPSKVSYLEM